MVRPLIGADLCEVGALVAGAINQQAANEDFRISPKVIFWLRVTTGRPWREAWRATSDF
jgi:hypothetical protein